jgi:2-polyprenyl-3-methyl-5-hydroxy-6-metoxy-1,4-benzoquinol methylase
MTIEIENNKPVDASVLTPERVSRYFGESRNYLDIRRYIIEIRQASVREFLDNRTSRRILDVGCGDGSISIPLLNDRNRLTLLDVSENMLARAMSQVSPALQQNVETIHQEFLSAALEPGSYDLITCIGVLAHVTEPELVISKLVSLLEPGGLLILECTDSENFTIELTMLADWVRRPFRKANTYRTRLNSASHVIAIAQQAGLTLVSTYRYNQALPLMGKVFSQNALRQIILWIFGTTKTNRNAWLGKECLFLFQKASHDSSGSPSSPPEV